MLASALVFLLAYFVLKRIGEPWTLDGVDAVFGCARRNANLFCTQAHFFIKRAAKTGLKV